MVVPETVVTDTVVVVNTFVITVGDDVAVADVVISASRLVLTLEVVEELAALLLVALVVLTA